MHLGHPFHPGSIESTQVRTSPIDLAPTKMSRFPSKSAVRIPKSLFDSKKDSGTTDLQIYQWQGLGSTLDHDRTDRSASISKATLSPLGSPQETRQYGTPDFWPSKSTSESALPTKISGLRDPKHA